MTVNTSSGSKISIGTTAAVSSTDTYVLIGEVVNLGEFGRVYSKIEHKPLDNRGTQKFKGNYDDGALNLQLGRSASDAGQAAMIVALDSDHDYNFKVALNDDTDITGSVPTTFFMKAKVMSYKTNVGNSDQIVQATTTLEVKSGSITETPAT